MKKLLLSARLFLLRAHAKVMLAGQPPELAPFNDSPTKPGSSISASMQWGLGLVSVILLLLPFHAIFTTWAGSNFGHIDVFRIWKELLCIPLVAICLWQLWKKPKLRAQVFGSSIFWLAFLYSVFMALMGVWALRVGNVNGSALTHSLLGNGRLVVFLVITWVLGLQSPWLHKHWQKLVIGPALLVVSFGILQRLVLPVDFLRHVGYGADTIPAVQTVDEQASFRRIQSTLRGANPLGAYLVLILTALAALLVRRKQGRDFGGFLVAATAGVLLVTYSRSAYVGAAASIGMVLWLMLVSQKWRRSLVVAGCAFVLLLGAVTVALRDHDFVQNVVFHSSEKSPSAQSSNAGRAFALRQGMQEVLREPLGRGPGTAGPASFRNQPHLPRIAENYYLQLAQEVGFIGLGLFMALTIVVAQQLWHRRQDMLAAVLLASLAGLTIVNLLSHAWTDDTIGLLWWGLAGVAISTPRATMRTKANKERKHRDTKANGKKGKAKTTAA